MRESFVSDYRKVFQPIAIEENRFGFEPEITAKIDRKGVRIYEVGISYHGRNLCAGENNQLEGWFSGAILYREIRDK